jgi:hypothetical protein
MGTLKTEEAANFFVFEPKRLGNDACYDAPFLGCDLSHVVRVTPTKPAAYSPRLGKLAP